MQIKEKIKKNLPSLIITVMLFAVGFVCGLFMISFMDRASATGIEKGTAIFLSYMLLVSFIFSMYLHTVIHEAGHLVFGLLSGYRFLSFRIGSLMLMRADGKLKFKTVRVAGTGGQCLMAPPETENVPVLMYNFGGVILNTAVAVISLVLYFVFSKVLFWSQVLLMFSLIGFALALTNGIPLGSGMLDNDGKNALSSHKDAVARKAFATQLKIGEQLHNGVRLKDMPTEWFEADEDMLTASTLTASIAVFKCNRLLDEKNFDEAKTEIDKIIHGKNSAAGLHVNLITCDRIYIELITDGNGEAVETLLTKELKTFMRSMKKYPSVIRTEYALQKLYYKNTDEAEKQKILFEKMSRTYPYSADVESERELMQTVDEKTAEREPVSTLDDVKDGMPQVTEYSDEKTLESAEVNTAENTAEKINVSENTTAENNEAESTAEENSKTENG